MRRPLDNLQADKIWETRQGSAKVMNHLVRHYPPLHQKGHAHEIGYSHMPIASNSVRTTGKSVALRTSE
ncbi:uncharacterized protein EI90DRAFT_3091742 [Cantharellus anzutake]|uniref:uncharacterized protein n=1 Tax=Cantharellus anzutake TaxID=1750568 RepID=UPI0019088EAB|nr:uncharacterized protein EI90DRAFT_3091742 [Cantharellus anzutake]KAF8313533.1 hypothetical protein EI90DRAFT_3091742 [Cantharellus anzutake]